MTRSVEAMFDEEFEASCALVSRLTDDQWTVPSLCPGWSVRDVVVHLAYHTHRSGLKETLPNLDKTTAMMVEREDASSRDGLLRWLSSPPAPTERKSRGTLAELVIHQQDIRRPLGLPRDYPEDALRSSLDLCTTRSGNIFVIDRRFRLGSRIAFGRHGSRLDVRQGTRGARHSRGHAHGYRGSPNGHLRPGGRRRAPH